MAKRMLTNEVADLISKMVIENYSEGAKMPSESELAETFDVSRATIREAVKLLSAKNVLEVRRGDGTYVAKRTGLAKDPLGFKYLDPDTCFRDLAEFSVMIQPDAASLAAIRATDEDISRLEAIHEEYMEKYEKYLQDGSCLNDIRKLDNRFHDAVLSATGNLVISRISAVLEEVYLFADKEQDLQRLSVSAEYHGKVLEAIRNHDSFAAYHLMMLHITVNNSLNGIY